MNFLAKPLQIEVSQHGFATIEKNANTGEQSLIAKKAYRDGDLITTFSAKSTSSTPTYLTVQTGENIHITLEPEFLQYINHSCNPNVFFDTTSMQLIALKDISQGDEFVFFYPSTEWKMTQPFNCYCNASNCLKNIEGAYSLLPATIDNYRFTDFIQQKLANLPLK